MSDTQVISYASPVQDPRPAKMWMAQVVLYFGVIPPVVGLGILGLYRLTAWESLVGFGFLWIYGGGALAFVALVWGALAFFLTKRHAANGKRARRYHLIGAISGLLAFPIAFFCMMVGIQLFEGPHYRLRVTNNTARAIDEVTVHFSSGDVTLGPIKPKETDGTGLRWKGHSGPLFITVRIGDQSRKRMDRVYCAVHNLKGPYYDLQVEDSELPAP